MGPTTDSRARRPAVESGADEDTPQAMRDAVIEAALAVIRERGLAQTRTSEIARVAGCAEGSIYRYFSGKSELVHEVIHSRLVNLIGMLADLPKRAGTATVEANLLEAAATALASYGEATMLFGGLFADTGLLTAERDVLAGEGVGPLAMAGNLAAYLKAEQELGRVRPEADVEVAARSLLASCLGESVFRAIDPAVDAADQERYVRGLVKTVLGGLATAIPARGSGRSTRRRKE